jgi:hypothetical protein
VLSVDSVVEVKTFSVEDKRFVAMFYEWRRQRRSLHNTQVVLVKKLVGMLCAYVVCRDVAEMQL